MRLYRIAESVCTWGLLVLLLAAAGCATTKCPRADTVCEPQANDVQLRPGDVVKVKFAYWPELDEQQTVRPDGKIALQLVGEVNAGGMTPNILREQLVGLYAPKLNSPVISVILESAASHRVYVGGEVHTPGLVVLNGRLTVLAAIMQAGGFIKESARLKEVLVIRQRDGKQHVTRVDIKQALKHPETNAVYLEPQDVVYVPRTAIDKVDQWVDQYINKIVPNNIHWTLSTDTDSPEVDNKNTTLQLQLPTL